VNKANNAQADLFISIHCDAFTSSHAIGSSSFVMGMHKNEESLGLFDYNPGTIPV
jgi:N-acetylmuramoyl-L-alanine amidase